MYKNILALNKTNCNENYLTKYMVVNSFSVCDLDLFLRIKLSECFFFCFFGYLKCLFNDTYLKKKQLI